MVTLIRNGRVVTAAEDCLADVLIDNGRIVSIGERIEVGGDVEVHDATGLLVLPGGVDVNTHLTLRSATAATADTFGSATRAAAFGGTTTVVDFCAPQPGQRLLSALEEWQRLRESACIDSGAHMVVLDASDESLAEMVQLACHEGVSSFGLHMGVPGSPTIDDGACFTALRTAGTNGAMCCVHADNAAVVQSLVDEALAQGQSAPSTHALTRPPLLEGEAVHRAACLAELAGTPLYFARLSAAQALAALSDARGRGIAVYAETCPHYLLLDDSEYERPGFEAAKAVTTPPLRDHSHLPQLWRAIATDAIQVVASDHRAFCFAEQPYGLRFSKQQGRDSFVAIPSGVPGIETRLPLMFDAAVLQQGLSINRVVAIMATTPAKLFGLFPRKGTIAIGSDGDVVLFDPAEQWTIRATEQHGRVDYSLFEGREICGRVKKVFARGRCIVDGTRWLGHEGAGRFLRRGECGVI